MRWPHIALFATTAALAYFAGCQAEKSRSDEVWQKVDSLQATAKSERSARLRADSVAGMAMGRADSLEAVAANLARPRPIPVRVVIDTSSLDAAKTTIRELSSQNETLRQENADLRQAFAIQQQATAELRLAATGLREELGRASNRITALELTLDAVEESERCQIGPVACPSRTTSALIGAGVGILALLTVSR